MPPSPLYLGANTTRPVAEWLARSALATTLNGCAACKIKQPRNYQQDSEPLRDRLTQKLGDRLYLTRPFPGKISLGQPDLQVIGKIGPHTPGDSRVGGPTGLWHRRRKNERQLLILLVFPVRYAYNLVGSFGQLPPPMHQWCESFLGWTYVSRGRVQRRPPIS
jgi:hypothetical protein